MLTVRLCWQTLSMDKAHSASGSSSPAALSSSPASRSAPIPESVATTESPSTVERRQAEPLSTKSLHGAAALDDSLDKDKSPFNVYAQAATSTFTEWFGTFAFVVAFVFHVTRFAAFFMPFATRQCQRRHFVFRPSVCHLHLFVRSFDRPNRLPQHLVNGLNSLR